MNNEYLRQGIDELIKRYAPEAMSQESIDLIHQCAHVAEVRKGENVIPEGQTHQHAYIIMRGGVRSFYLKEGVEVCSWFAFENEFIGSLENYFGRSSKETISAIEDTVLVGLKLGPLKSAKLRSVDIANFIGNIMEEYLLFMEERLAWLQLSTAKERYDYVMSHDSNLFRRVPLTYIASYLGMTRETLSRLRAR